ncbi:hypothetical protein [uncultured Roseibium sp.]|uniref:hypothetical protein n=1 Tax=uncultured Roseibium sp. TaxID=1936171 RepID=UPI00261211DA|nr:hypothetical protein [uncultured Roseibium sp.]
MKKGPENGPLMGRRTFLGATLGAGALLSSTSLSTAAGARLATAEQSSITHEGITFTTSVPVRFGAFVNGWPVAISDRSFTITMTPSSGDLQGDGRIGNGVMQDPFIDWSGDGEQGFEAYIGEGGTGTKASATPYNDKLNLRSIEINAGDETSIVAAPRIARFVDETSWQTIRAYPTLTVLAEPPFEDALPPAPSATAKSMPRASEINWNVFRQIKMPAGYPTLVATSTNLPSSLGIYGQFPRKGENLRRFRLDVAIGNTKSNYSGHIIEGYMQACFSLLDDRYTEDQKAPLLYKIIGFGKQIDEIFIRSGFNDMFLFSGAGQGLAWYPFWVIAGFALQDGGMLARAAFARTQWDQTYWVDQDRIDSAVPVGNFTNIPQGWFQEMLGMPMIAPTGNDSNLDSRYGEIAGRGVAWEALFLMFLQDGPSGETGYSWRLQGGADDKSNPRASVFGFMDRMRLIDPTPQLYTPGPLWNVLYDKFHSLGLRAKWTGVPDQPHLGYNPGFQGNPGDFFKGGDGQISWDYSRRGEYSSLPILERAVRYSLDGRQWVAQTVDGNTGTINGLIKGQAYYCGYRLRNQAGWGPWSQNYRKMTKDKADRNVVATKGTDRNSEPVNTVAPKLLEKLLPNWDEDPGNWAEMADQEVLTEAGKVYACGLGDWTGFPAPAFSFQWVLNGEPVRGATDPTYTGTTDGDPLLCRLTASNAVGTPAVINVGNSSKVTRQASSVQVVQAVTSSDQAPDGVHGLTIPAGIQPGNLLVAAFRTAAPGILPVAPKGWESVGSSPYIHVFAKALDGTEAGTNVSWMQAAGGSSSCFGLAEISGASGRVEVAFSETLDPPPISPAGEAADTVFLVLSSSQRTIFDVTDPPPNYEPAEPIEAQSTPKASTSGAHCQIGFAHRSLAKAGPEKPGAFGWSGAVPWAVAGCTIAVR